MNRPGLLLAALFVAPLLIPGASATLDSEEWTEEVPGIADAAVQVTIAGNVDKQALIWERTNGTWGFALRENQVWSQPAQDVTASWLDINNADLCHLITDTWLVAGENAGALYLYETTDDGATWAAVSSWTNLHTSGTFGLDCRGDSAVLAWRTPGGVGVDAVNATVGAKTGGSWSFSADQVAIPETGLSIIRSVDVGMTTNRHYVALADRVKFQFTYSDDGGAFWATAATVGPASSSCGAECKISVDGYGEADDWVISGTYYDGVEAIPWTEHNEGGHIAVAGPPTGFICPAQRCENAVDEHGRVLSGLPRSGAANRLYFDSNDGAGFVEQTGDDIPTAIDMSALIDEDLAMIAYIDDDQGDRVEVRHTVVLPPIETYTNPNGNNWGDIRTNWDLFFNDSEIYAKERFSGEDASQGNVFRFDNDLILQNRWDACPPVSIGATVQISSTKDETLSTVGGLSVGPGTWSPVITTACLDDFSITDEFFGLRFFTETGGWSGYSPINTVAQVNDVAWIETCSDAPDAQSSQYGILAHFTQTHPINLTFFDKTQDGIRQHATHDEDRATVWNAIRTGLTAVAADPLSQTTNCRAYTLSDGTGEGLKAHTRQTITDSEWALGTVTGDGLTAYNGTVWVTDSATNSVTRLTDQGNSATVDATGTMTTAITDFNEQLRASKDGAYLMARCDTNDVCIYNSTDFSLIYTATLPAGGVILYDMDVSNSYLYIARDTVIYRHTIESYTDAFGDPDNCVSGNCTTPFDPDDGEETSTSTSTLNPDGRLDDPEFFGVDFSALNGVSGVSSSGWAWLIGMFFVVAGGGIGATAAAASKTQGTGFAVLVLGGTTIGIVAATAFNLWPLWPIVVFVFLMAAALLLARRS